MARIDRVRGRSGLLAIAVLVAGCVLLLQPFGFNQGAHYALVKALAHGTARIDDYQGFSGDESWYHGHYFSNKAPGVAFLCLPFYLVLRAVGRADEAAGCFRRALDLRPDYVEAHDGLLLTLHYRADVTPEELAQATQEWADAARAYFAEVSRRERGRGLRWDPRHRRLSRY